MARFTETMKGAKTLTENRAGGDAYKQTDKLELVSMLLTSFLSDQYYRSGQDGFDKLVKLVKGSDPEFAAKAAIYARDNFGMRSVSHVVAGEIPNRVKGEEWVKRFIQRVIVRPDDALEIMGYQLKFYGKPIPNSLKKGIKMRVEDFDEYQLSKYKKSNSNLKMVDLVNLVHPKANPHLSALIKGTLKPAETWETKLTQAGQKAETAEQKEQLKADSWRSMIMEGKLPYFALLRNLRNILESSEADVVTKACKMLVNPEAIKKSRVLPFRFYSAYVEVKKIGGSDSRQVLSAISKALDISCSNMPVLKGKTCVFLDDSGSMGCHMSDKSERSVIDVASVFAAALAKAQNADVVMFSDTARDYNYDIESPVLSMVDEMKRSARMSGTNFIAPWEKIMNDNREYDRVIILSDMQGWMDTYWSRGNLPADIYKQYKKKFDLNTFVYSWDMAGYGDMQFPENQVALLAGFSEKLLDLFEVIEQDKNALIKEIDAIDL